MIKGKYLKHNIGDFGLSSHIDAVHAAPPNSDQFTGSIVRKVINSINASGIIATISRDVMNLNRPRDKNNALAIDEYRAIIRTILGSKNILDDHQKLNRNYLHLAIHGMKDEHKADFVIGTRNGYSCSNDVLDWFVADLKKLSKNIRINEIFPGDRSKSVHRFGDGPEYPGYGQKFHTIQIEISRTWRKTRQKQLVLFLCHILKNFDKSFNNKISFSYDITGFARDAAYSAHLSKIMGEFENDFKGLESLHLNIKELSYFQLANPEKEKFKYGKDGKNLEITWPVWKTYDRKGKAKATPIPYDFFQMLRGTLSRATKNYKERAK